MSIYEYNEEEHIRLEREAAFEDGIAEGRKQEQINTERERQRAEQERRRAEKAEAELMALKKQFAKK